MAQARPEDVASIDGIVKALYEVVSGPAGERDWQRERSLFLPGGQLVPTRPLPEGGTAADRFDVEGYIGSRTPFFAANDFYEVEVARRVERFGAIAQVWSVYEGRREPGGEPILRGINGIQLFDDGERWWVVSILWSNESAENPIPREYLLAG